MILKALPKMIEEASSPQLRTAFEQHLQQTQGHVQRLNQIFDQLSDVDREDKKCKGMEDIIKDAKDLLSEDAEPEVLDAGMIAGAQRVEHYEIAGNRSHRRPVFSDRSSSFRARAFMAAVPSRVARRRISVTSS